MVPDFEAEESPSDRRSGTDTVMSFTRALIERESRGGTVGNRTFLLPDEY